MLGNGLNLGRRSSPRHRARAVILVDERFVDFGRVRSKSSRDVATYLQVEVDEPHGTAAGQNSEWTSAGSVPRGACPCGSKRSARSDRTRWTSASSAERRCRGLRTRGRPLASPTLRSSFRVVSRRAQSAPPIPIRQAGWILPSGASNGASPRSSYSREPRRAAIRPCARPVVHPGTRSSRRLRSHR